MNGAGELVAKIPLDDSAWTEGYALAVLPAGSEISLTLTFDITLPPGSYRVRLTCWHENHGSSLFIIP